MSTAFEKLADCIRALTPEQIKDFAQEQIDDGEHDSIA